MQRRQPVGQRAHADLLAAVLQRQLRDLLQELVELHARALHERAAERPREAEHEDGLDLLRLGDVARLGEQRVEELAQLLHERQVGHGHGLPQGVDDDHVGLVLDALDDVVDADGEVLCEEAAQHLLLLGPLAAVEPLVRVRRVAQVLGVDVDHAASGDGRG